MICPTANLEDLDPVAILKARENYKSKYPEQIQEVDEWNDITFLNKAKITIKDKITNTALILLGKPESEHFLTPAIVKIRWILKDEKGSEKDYRIYSSPLLLNAEKIYQHIRNLKYRYLKGSSLFPEEIDQYEPYIIREAMNNCIAHQDYTMGGYINLVEKEDGYLIFTNLGRFIPGSIDKVIRDDAPEEYYRNKFLVTAMFNLKMVDTIGSGIRRIFAYQAKRFFPMPDYDLSENKVKITITGKIIDSDFANALAENADLTLEEISLLDKVQKKKPLEKEELRLLRNKGLVEGKLPNIYISAKLAQATGMKADYTLNKAFDKQYYQDLIIQALKQHGSLNKLDIIRLLLDKLSLNYNEKQRISKVNNLIQELRVKNIIRNTGSDHKPVWVLIK